MEGNKQGRKQTFEPFSRKVWARPTFYSFSASGKMKAKKINSHFFLSSPTHTTKVWSEEGNAREFAVASRNDDLRMHFSGRQAGGSKEGLHQTSAALNSIYSHSMCGAFPSWIHFADMPVPWAPEHSTFWGGSRGKQVQLWMASW